MVLSYHPYSLFASSPAPKPHSVLPDTFLTPNDVFFIRNHLPVPNVNAEEYRLTVHVGPDRPPVVLSLHDLRTKYKQHTITAVLQCSGNRRAEMNPLRPTKGELSGF